MNNISNIAKGVLIGDGALAAFIEIGRNKNCGVGLFDYTTNNGLRKLNTFNNNPRTASYYSTLEKVENTPMSFKRYLGGNLVSAYNVDGLDIGWAYTTDVNNHRFSQGYASSADFDSFQKLLRERYFSNRKDGKPLINNVILEHGDKNQTISGVGPVNSRLFTEIDFSLPIGKSETELLTFNFKNSGITNNVESIIEFNKYDYTKQYLGYNSLTKDIYKVNHNLSKTDHANYEETKLPLNYNDSRDAFIDSKNGTEYGGVITGTNEDIVTYTKKLFDNKKISTLVNRSKNNEVSRGRKLKENSYCRVWTPKRQYSKFSDLIRPNGDNSYEKLQNKLSENMRPNGSTRLIENSVLQGNGFVRITPTSTIGNKGDNIKKYMFSIENLAWKDNKHELSEEQKGKHGRIMWFPPYNLKFSENINVNWNGNNFIGRGEQIYTYTNTERSGTLDFTLLIDHPSILNEWRGQQDIGNEKSYETELLHFFAGCDTLNMEDKPKIIYETTSNIVSGNNSNITPAIETIKKLLIIYFPNAFSGQDYDDVDKALLKLNPYEMNSSKTPINIIDNKYSGSSDNKNINSFSLNKDKGQTRLKTYFKDFEDKNIFTLNDLITINGGNVNYNPISMETDYKLSKITFYGGASSHGGQNINDELVSKRQSFIRKILDKINLNAQNITNNSDIGISTNNIDINSKEAKLARYGAAVLEYTRISNIPNSEDSTAFILTKNIDSNVQSAVRTETTMVSKIDVDYSFDNEYLYFEKIGENENMVSNILKRVRHFDPAFHSITPEGFNARLTFLHQCTRQGPTSAVNSGQFNTESNNYLKYAGNLSFGRAPYCILRIGDFFNTKIMIESISINYDNSGGLQWDLNPEGAGVQPMLANISMNFKFLGGQDIAGPIEKLQNAISSNYYANASVYDKKAEINKEKK